jgi:hypothetical protein
MYEVVASERFNELKNGFVLGENVIEQLQNLTKALHMDFIFRSDSYDEIFHE